MQPGPEQLADQLMTAAIERAKEGVAAGQSPFGCAISLGGEIVAAEHNRVLASTDITAHAEISALREACRRTGTIDLSGAIVASTCEPCAMCLGASLWSGFSRIVCGATREDAEALGFDEGPVFPMSYEYMENRGVEIVRGVQREAARAVLDDYKARGGLVYNR